MLLFKVGLIMSVMGILGDFAAIFLAATRYRSVERFSEIALLNWRARCPRTQFSTHRNRSTGLAGKMPAYPVFNSPESLYRIGGQDARVPSFQLTTIALQDWRARCPRTQFSTHHSSLITPAHIAGRRFGLVPIRRGWQRVVRLVGRGIRHGPRLLRGRAGCGSWRLGQIALG